MCNNSVEWKCKFFSVVRKGGRATYRILGRSSRCADFIELYRLGADNPTVFLVIVHDLKLKE